MYISNLKAEPNACGGQIDLSWKNPSLEEFPDFAGVKIVRREKRFPKISPPANFICDGILVFISRKKEESFSDKGLHGGRVYYYTLYTYNNSPTREEVKYFANRTSRIAAMAASHYGSEAELYKLVPAIYRRYDTDGELKRFLEIFGPQLDLIRSFIAGTRNFSKLDQCHGALLPLLAQWIGWETNFSLDLNSQRNEIQQAPELYKTLGIVANLRAFINRLINWNCQIKEFVHNVFLSNNPEQLHIRETTRQNGTWQPAKPVTLDVAYEGKMAAVSAQDGKPWLFYHARSNVFVPGTHLEKGIDKDLWHIYYKICDQGEWLPSHRLTFDGEINKYPAAVQDENGNFWVFWSAYSKKGGKFISQIKLTLLSTGNPAKPVPLPSETPPTQNIEPAVFKDNNHNIWIFWSSRRSDRWKIWYNCFNTTNYNWGTARQLTHGLCADREPAVVFDPGTGGKIWVFWTRKKSNGLWNIFYRTTTNLNFNTHTDTDWTEQELLDDNNAEPGFQRKEPTAILRDSNHIDLYFSSDETGSWNIRQKTFDKTPANWTNGEPVTSGHFTKKAPAILQDAQGNPRLLFRTNESIDYPSKLYIGTTTIDNRYSGSTTIDVKNRERIGGRGMLEDILQYVYDTGKENKDWYARDTIGLYLTPDTGDQQLIAKNRELVKGILDRFLPIHLRAVFIINPPVYPEKVYTYDFPKDENQRLINEQFFDSSITEIYPGMSEVYEDRVPDWIWIHSVEIKHKEGQKHVKYKDHRTVDFDASTIDTNHRTWHIGVKK